MKVSGHAARIWYYFEMKTNNMFIEIYIPAELGPQTITLNLAAIAEISESIGGNGTIRLTSGLIYLSLSTYGEITTAIRYADPDQPIIFPACRRLFPEQDPAPLITNE